MKKGVTPEQHAMRARSSALFVGRKLQTSELTSFELKFHFCGPLTMVAGEPAKPASELEERSGNEARETIW
eukprot:3778700-Amphidinium_carterae.1